MTDRPFIPGDDWLLDDHLGHLSDEQRRRLRGAMDADATLADRHRRLQRVLEPLDAWSTPPPPTDLVDRILDEILRRREDATVVREADLPALRGGGYAGRLRFSLHDLVAAAAVIAFFFAALFPGMSAVRERSRRVACANNLADIGRGVSAYSLAHDNALPYQRPAQRTSFLPLPRGTNVGVVYSPNARSVLLIARYRYVNSVRVFVCPSDQRRVPLNDLDPNAPEELVKQRLCSYDSLNMAGATPNYSLTCNLPYMADANPLFANGAFNPVDPKAANSFNHRRRGQNLLCLDGSVTWSTNPNSGYQHDNIWQAGNITRYDGTEVQNSVHDTFLVP